MKVLLQPSNFSVFLQRQIKCWGNYMKIHFASALPWQCFCWGWYDFIVRVLAFTWATSAKTSARSKLVRLLTLLHISPRIRSIKKTVFQKVLFMWSSMPGFSFIGYTLTELFRKPDNWWQIYKQTGLTFYTLINVSRRKN